LDGSPRTLPTGADEAGGTAVKFYELRDNLDRRPGGDRTRAEAAERLDLGCIRTEADRLGSRPGVKRSAAASIPGSPTEPSRNRRGDDSFAGSEVVDESLLVESLIAVVDGLVFR